MKLGSHHPRTRGEVFLKVPSQKSAPVLDSVEVTLDQKNAVLDAEAEKLGVGSIRQEAMAIALSWVEEGDHSFEMLDSVVQGFVGIEDIDDLTDEDEELYEALFDAVGEAFVSLGAAEGKVEAFIESESDKEGQALGKDLSEKMDEQVLDDAVLLGRFAAEGSLDEGLDNGEVMDAAKEKRIRNGKVYFKRKRTKKYIMSAKQRQALKKAQRKSRSSMAKFNRARSNKVRERRGMN